MLVLTGSQSPADTAGEQDALQAIDALEALGPAPALLLCRVGDDERAARLIRAALSRGAPGVLPVDESETRFRVLAHCLRPLSPRALGQAPVVIDALRPVLRTRVVLTSVRRVAIPSPSVWQHARSMLPGARFELDLNRNRITRISGPAWVAPAPGRMGVWAADDEKGRVTADLARLGLRRERLQRASRRWPAKAWAEMTVLDADSAPLVTEALARVARTSCPRCGRMSLPAGCLMCGTWPYADPPGPAPAPAPHPQRPPRPRPAKEIR